MSDSDLSNLANPYWEVEWKNFVFKAAAPENYQDILDSMRENFYKDEPLNIFTGYSEGKRKDLDRMITELFKDGLSCIIVEKETGKVAGAQISIYCRKGEPDRIPEMECPQMKQIIPFLELLDEAGPVFDFYPELDVYAELFMISIEKEFRGFGLATKSYQLVADILKVRGVKLLKSSFTNQYTQRIATKLGYRELARVYNRDYKDKNGDLVWPHVEDDFPEFYAIVGVLEIKTDEDGTDSK